MIYRTLTKYLVSFLLLASMPGMLKSQEQILVMPLGNSITRGSMCTNGTVFPVCEENAEADAIGYRKRLHDLLSGAGYNVDFVGKNSSGWSLMSSDTEHSGFAGIRDNELAEIMETGSSSNPDWSWVTPGAYMNSYNAHMVLLHVGTNDVFKDDYNASAINDILDAIDDFETAYSVPVLVFVSTIISERDYPCNTHTGTRTYNSHLRSIVQSRISSGDNLVLVDMECGAGIDYALDMADQVHPAQAGYDKMADHWFDAIDNYNTMPAVTAIPDQDADRGASFGTIDLDAYVTDAEDADGDLVWDFSPSDPVHFTISIDGGNVVTVTPKDGNWSGSEEITFSVTDQGKVLSQLKKTNTITVTYTVNWVPEITGQQTVSTPEDTPREIVVSDIIMVEPEKAPGGLQLILSDGPNYSINGATVTPDENFAGNLTVPVRLSGGGKVSDIYNLTVNVTEVNDPPVITGQARALETIQNSHIDIVTADLNVTDVDDNYPDGFTVLIQPGSGYTYSGNRVTPDPPVTGMLDVDVKVNDGEDPSNTYTIQVMVRSLTPGFILPGTLEVDEDVPYNGTVVINHYDPGSFSYNQVEIPDWLSFDTGSGVLSGTPANEDVGEHTLSLRITNGISAADTSFMITVNNVNDAPEFTSSTLEKAQTSLLYNFTVEVTDADPGDQLTFTAIAKPGWMDLNSETGLLTGVPDRGDTGMTEVNLRVSDGETFVEQVFPLEVEFYNHPPEFVSDPKDTAEAEQTYVYGALVSDFEDDPVSYFGSTIPEWAQFVPASQVLIGQPTRDDHGPHLVIIGATDGIDTSYQIFTVEVIWPLGVGIDDMDYDHQITIYPNPVTSQLFVRRGEDGADKTLRFTITDMSGRSLLDTELRDEVTTIHLPGYVSRGTYLYQVRTLDNSRMLKTGKIIKQ